MENNYKLFKTVNGLNFFILESVTIKELSCVSGYFYNVDTNENLGKHCYVKKHFYVDNIYLQKPKIDNIVWRSNND